MKKWGRGTAIVIAVFLFLGVGICGWRWFTGRQARVLAGFARPTFPYGDYTMEELGKLYPQNIENNAPTVQSPEQTHQKFLAALKKGDFDEAVRCCFREGDREKVEEVLKKLDTVQLGQMISNLDTKIKSDSVNSWKSVYSYSVLRNGEKNKLYLSFVKSQDGIWYIESL